MAAFRVGGAGLGNILLSWARSLVAAERLGVPMLEPTWPSLKIGTILRREKDKRTYSDLFVRDPLTVHSTAWLAALAQTRTIVRFVDPTLIGDVAERTLLVPLPDQIAPEYFAGLFDYRDLIAERLFAISRKNLLPAPRADSDVLNVAVHVRAGDFKEADAAVQSYVNTRLPISWYRDRMDALRTASGGRVRFTLVSDGTAEELSPLIEHSDTLLRPPAPALADLFVLAQADLAIYACSTFSLWACFLSGRPSIWHPGGLLQAYPPKQWTRFASGEGTPLPGELLELARARRNSVFNTLVMEHFGAT